jgi:hypothetical protein
MSSRPSSSLRRCAALVWAVLLIGCGGTSPSAPPVSGPAGATAAPSARATTPAASPRPTQAAGLPEPALTDAAAINAALFDPAQVGVGVASLLALLGIAIDADDGTPLRAGDAAIFPDFHLSESEVRGLIEMGVADATDIAAGQVPWTLANLHQVLAPALSGMTQEQLVGLYIDAYRAAPGDFVREVLNGHPLLPTTAFTRVHLWLLLVDGILGRQGPNGTASRSGTAAFTAFRVGAQPQTAAGAVANVAMPPIPSPVPGLDLRDYVVLLAHLPLLAWMVPMTVTAAPSTAHEGHGGPGPSVAIEARAIDAMGPVVSPVDGHVLLQPITMGLDGVPITFEASNESTLNAHGSITLPGLLGYPVRTDVLGQARLQYDLREEPANGSGNLQTDVVILQAIVDLRTLLLQRYVFDPSILMTVWGDRRALTILTLEWHEAAQSTGTFHVTLTGKKAGAGTYNGTAEIYCVETPSSVGAAMWTATTLPDRATGVSHITLSQLEGGQASVGVEVTAQTEFGPWGGFSNMAGQTATVTAVRNGPLVEMHGTASVTDTAGNVFATEVSLTCTPLT